MAVVRQFLLISDAAAPLVSGEAPLGVVGLARALAAAGTPATVLSLASPEAAMGLPGLARRLTTLKVRTEQGTREVLLFEGKASLSQAHLVVVGAEGRNRGESAVLLAEALRASTDDGLLKADVAIAWGETAALALSITTAAIRIFVLPSGRGGEPLSEPELEAMRSAGYADNPTRHNSLAALGAAFANAIIAPSPSAARILEADAGLAERASDEPVVAVRFGCDEPPQDPASDVALPVNFSAKSLLGKAECRRIVVRRHSLAIGPRTLILGVAALRHGKGGEALLDALPALGTLDVAILIPGEGDPDLIDRARRLAIQSPGRLALMDSGAAEKRLLRAASDAVLFGDSDDRIGRAAGLAQRYGALPIALDGGASRDYLVDYDASSGTGTAILYGAGDRHEIEAAVQRVVALRATADVWTPLCQRVIEAAPHWSETAAAFDEICDAYA